eukprot:PhM_4_TR16999/c0_g1_i1/m.97470
MTDFSSSSGESDIDLDRCDVATSDSDSGQSDVIEDKRMKMGSRKSRRRNQSIHEIRRCTLCETNAVQYRCASCGNLEYCKDCCIRMHNNRYLSLHRITVLLTDEVIDVESLWIAPNGEALFDDDEVASPRRRIDVQVTSPLHEEYSDSFHCRFHPQISIDMMCLSCDVPVCASCNKPGERHAGCTMIPITQQLSSDRSVIQQRVVQLKDSHDKLNLIQNKLELERLSTKRQCDQLCDQIRGQMSALRAMIDDAEQKYVDAIHAAACERNRIVETQLILVRDGVSDVDIFLKDAQHELLQSRHENVLNLLPRRLTLLDGSTDAIDKSADIIERSASRLENIAGLTISRNCNTDVVAYAITKLSQLDDTDWKQQVTACLNGFGNDGHDDAVGGQSTAVANLAVAAQKLEPPKRMTEKEFTQQNKVKVWVQRTNSPQRVAPGPDVGCVTPRNDSPARSVQELRQQMRERKNSPARSAASPFRDDASVASSGTPNRFGGGGARAGGGAVKSTFTADPFDLKDKIKNRIVQQMMSKRSTQSPTRNVAPVHTLRTQMRADLKQIASSPVTTPSRGREANRRYPSPAKLVTPNAISPVRAATPDKRDVHRGLEDRSKKDMPGPGTYTLPSAFRTMSNMSGSRVNSPSHR